MKFSTHFAGLVTGVFGLAMTTVAFAQQPKINNIRAYDKSGINVFEPKKENETEFNGPKLKIGAGFTQQYQSLKHENSGKVALYRLDPGFGVAQANLYVDAQLADGILLNMTSYLSSRHHNESWVKGGFIQFDKLPFKGQFWQNLMKVATIKMGHMEINYGDTHFRRTDGGHALYNPFIENYLMDAFATEVAGEVYLQKNGLLGMVGLSNGLINGGYQASLVPGSTTQTYKRNPSIYAKLAYDKKLNEKMRFRASGSVYYNNSQGRSTLYGGDRTGSNYFYVLEGATATAKDNAFSGRINPGLTNQIMATQVNLFYKIAGLELFGVIENSTGGTNAEKEAKFEKRSANQYAFDAVYRIGAKENVFVGARYNLVEGQMFAKSTDKQTISRTAIGAGWFVLPSVLLKGEYVKQKYEGYPSTNILDKGKFSGVVVEAIVGF